MGAGGVKGKSRCRTSLSCAVIKEKYEEKKEKKKIGALGKKG